MPCPPSYRRLLPCLILMCICSGRSVPGTERASLIFSSRAMFRKILIANRGEIALRILSACRELGVKTVAVYSEADRNSLHVRFADEAICIGPPRSSESYLNIPQVISAAEIANVDAIHPGYGFLSENANFAEVCEASHITFIGPAPDAIRLMGEKDKAREAMKEAGLPIIPGSPGVVADEESAKKIAAEIGYPVMIKAAEGGGGRGMRIVRHSRELIPMFQTARTEAEQAFGSPNVYMEKLIEHPRHIEFQVLGDKHGNVIHLGERECSLQRRHQKVLEESPSLAVDPATRKRIGKQVVDALKKLGYSSAGTVEFLREESGQLYFIEMNARIQVEHPVTEMVTGVDLVKSQIRVAAGEKLADVLAPVEFRGHAIECRINAEDPETFTPSAGRITAFRVPGGPGIRVDTACYADAVIPPYYDSLIAKIIAHGDNRAEAIARMNRALDGFVVEGIKTTIALHKKILADPDFIAGKFDTHFLDRPAAVAANK
jgi:acetyl-CoA carboxylase biotin carboxylase subunit